MPEKLFVITDHIRSTAFLVRRACAHNSRPHRPGRIHGPTRRRLRQNLKLVNFFCALTASSSDTIAAGITAAYYHDNPAFAVNDPAFGVIRSLGTIVQSVLHFQIIHCKNDIFITPALHLQVSWLPPEPIARHNTVEHLAKVTDRNILTGRKTRLKLNTFCGQSATACGL